jgi:hypothetical protein
MTDEEFQKVWDYFCFYVFPKEKINIMNQIIKDSIEYVEFLDFTDKLKGRNFHLHPYFGIKYSKTCGTYMGLSYEFQREVNNETYNIENCKGWDHLFKDAINQIQWKDKSFAKKGEKEHGVPYYQYSFNLSVVEPWEDKSVEDMQKMLDRDLLGQNWNEITRYISGIMERFAKHYDMELKIYTKTYGNRGSFDKNSYKFEIRLEDFDFEPKPNSEIWN